MVSLNLGPKRGSRCGTVARAIMGEAFNSQGVRTVSGPDVDFAIGDLNMNTKGFEV
jgi:hypothetical protein